jgi:hypothetical protein
MLIKKIEVMEITRYNSDSGNRDMSTESYDKDMSFFEVLQRATQLKAPLIVKTSYVNDERPGAWYIKGQNSNFSYEDIKIMVEENVQNNKHSKRVCYLIKYFD